MSATNGDRFGDDDADADNRTQTSIARIAKTGTTLSSAIRTEKIPDSGMVCSCSISASTKTAAHGNDTKIADARHNPAARRLDDDSGVLLVIIDTFRDVW